MFERFSDRARKVMSLANEQAAMLEHEHVGSEHILLGLAEEGSGVGCATLKNLEIEPAEVQKRIMMLVRRGTKSRSVPKWRRSPGAKKVVELAILEARYLKHNYVGTEHLLLGLLHDKEAIGAQVLTALKLDVVKVRAAVLELLGQQPDPASVLPHDVELSLYDRIVRCLELYDPLIKPLVEQKDEAFLVKEYKRAAELGDQIIAQSAHKVYAIARLIEGDGSLPTILNRIRKHLPDADVQPGQVVLAIFEAYPELRDRLGHVYDEVRNACAKGAENHLTDDDRGPVQ